MERILAIVERVVFAIPLSVKLPDRGFQSQTLNHQARRSKTVFFYGILRL